MSEEKTTVMEDKTNWRKSIQIVIFSAKIFSKNQEDLAIK